MEKRKRKCIETRLPEAIIHIIQSFLSDEEAARTTVISKSWYKAWLTRPALVLVLRNLRRKSSAAEFSKFAAKTMRRYQDSNLKIESLSLKMRGCRRSSEPLARKLIADAMKLGATDLKLEFFPTGFALPAEVLGSETLLRLSVSGCKIDGNVNCSMLKSLSLDSVLLKREDMLRILTSCCNSIEELSLSNSPIVNYIIELRWQNLHEFHKLKRLYLERVPVGNSLTYLESQCPCLEDLSLVHCYNTGIHVKSSSLQRISIVQCAASGLQFEVPNLAVFSYSGRDIPAISIKARDEWESHISIERHHNETSSWYRDLHKRLTQLSLSRINLTIKIVGSRPCTNRCLNDIRAVANPVAVENMRVETEYDVGRIMRCLFRMCRPKLVTLCWLDCDCECWMSNNHSLRTLCEKLMGPTKRRKMFELKEGKMEVYEEDVAEWRPLLLQDATRAPPMGRKVRFHLKW
ncbi:uncharacterized protein LOC130991625 [Salvia miltiorrhiza]|uniref:uncharacterized protein LOC130991625 n=1 Tax=Salvia miltiorrhiza TaxID=226208 RepID=UPI0025AB7608|nr:uncharacterized protein LOC130991625 [Salvia miltiorrhiza]